MTGQTKILLPLWSVRTVRTRAISVGSPWKFSVSVSPAATLLSGLTENSRAIWRLRGVIVGAGVRVGVRVGVAVRVGVLVGVLVRVGVTVGVTVAVRVGVKVGDDVGVGVFGNTIGSPIGVGVAVGGGKLPIQ